MPNSKLSTEGEPITDTTTTRSQRREIAAYFFETAVLPRSEMGLFATDYVALCGFLCGFLEKILQQKPKQSKKKTL